MALDPPLSWPGGKRKHAEALVERVLQHLQPSGRYIEPFLGAGAVALAMPPGTPMILGDACLPLGHLWWWLQREPEAISEYAAGYGLVMNNTGWNTRERYGLLRKEHKAEPFSVTDWRPSARFLWLMRACFNGIYRENKDGVFNVPWGARERIAMPTAADLRAIADHIATADIRPGWDFEDVMTEARPGDVIFTDPPYHGGKAAFTGYVKGTFERWNGVEATAQVRLAQVSYDAVARGATVIMTNADTPFIRELYTGWQFDAIVEDRPVAAQPRARKSAHCVIVTGRW
jgi:DNA adenine methylase